MNVTLLHGASPQAHYEFFDLTRLRRYFDGGFTSRTRAP